MRLRHVMQLSALALAIMPLHTDAAGQADEKGFTTLFNGKDLTGWVYGRRANGAENKSGQGYQIEKGVLYSTKDDGGNLYTEKDTPTSSSGSTSSSPRTPTTASASARRWKAMPRTSASRSRYSTTAGRYTKLQPYQYHGSIYGIFAEARIPEAGRRVEQRGDHREGPADHGEAERHHDRRRAVWTTSRTRRSSRRTRAVEAGRVARHRQHQGPHRLPRPRRARRVPQHQSQGVVILATAAQRASNRRARSSGGIFFKKKKPHDLLALLLKALELLTRVEKRRP